VGGNGNDTLQGGNSSDTLSGGDGDDLLIGGLGTDVISGDAGNDRIVWNNADGSDTIHGGAGIDALEVNTASSADALAISQVNGVLSLDRTSSGAFTLTVDEVEQLTIRSQDGDDSLLINDLTGTALQTIVVLGGNGNDRLDGQNTNVQLTADGGTGNDTLIGGRSNDVLIAGSGNDVLTGNAGSDSFIINSNAPFQIANLGVDIITDFDVDDPTDPSDNFDKIILGQATFSALTSLAGGALLASEFAVVNNNLDAETSAAVLVYNVGSGALFYNANGTATGFEQVPGDGTGGQFATLAGNPSLSAADFLIQSLV
jgi:Ca2+-binding RTX toxin-like protein